MNEENNNLLPPQEEQTISESPDIKFVSSGSSLKKKKNPFVFASICTILLLILSLIGYFVIYPYIVTTYIEDPKDVFSSTIINITNEINSSIKEKKEKETYSLEIAMETDIPEFQKYKGYTYSTHFGKDINKIEMGYGIEKEKYKYSQTLYKNNNQYYTKFSTQPNEIYYLEETQQTEQFFNSILNFTNKLEKINKEDISYITNKISKKVIESIDKENITKEKTSIKLNGENRKVIKNSYTMNQETQRKTIDILYSTIIEDEKIVSILSTIMDKDQKTCIEFLQNKIENINTEKEIIISIYSYGTKSQIIGYSYEKKDTNSMHYYKNKENFEIELTNIVKDTKNIKIIGTSKEIKILKDDQEILLLNKRKWDKDTIDLDYTIYANSSSSLENNLSGTFLYNKENNSSEEKYSLSLKVFIENHSITLNANLVRDWDTDVSKINTQAAKGINETTYNEIQRDLINHLLKETPLQVFFSTLSDSYDIDIYKYYEEENKINEQSKNLEE